MPPSYAAVHRGENWPTDSDSGQWIEYGGFALNTGLRRREEARAQHFHNLMLFSSDTP